MQRSQRCVWPLPLIYRAVHCSDCLGHYLCYHNCACHEPHTAVFHVSWTWTRLTCGADLLLSSLVSTCLCWHCWIMKTCVNGLLGCQGNSELHNTSLNVRIRLEAPDNYMYSLITATLRSIQVAHTYSCL